jgi:hypothetical protein
LTARVELGHAFKIVKYRAVLIEPEATRETKPDQIFGPTIGPLEAWAKSRLQSAPDGSSVGIYETFEKPVRLFVKTSNLAGEPAIRESTP